MNILLLGASGFIGRRVAALLQAQGHDVQMPSHREVDFMAPNEAQIRLCLVGRDVVINCVGVMSRHASVLEQVHHHVPATLAAWARAAGVQRWVQLSALGADAAQHIAFVGSKGRGDESLRHSGLAVAVARPSVVYGRGGASTEWFLRAARLPLLLLPDGGRFELQPVHVADVAAGLVALAVSAQPPEMLAFTGAQCCTLAEYLSLLRQTVHHRAPMHIGGFPSAWLKPLLPVAKLMTNGLLSADSLALLAQGACADNRDFIRLLGHRPLAVNDFSSVV